MYCVSVCVCPVLQVRLSQQAVPVFHTEPPSLGVLEPSQAHPIGGNVSAAGGAAARAVQQGHAQDGDPRTTHCK